MIRFLPLLVLCGALAGGRQDSESERPCNSYLGKRVPALSGGNDDWLNAREAPSLDGVKGRVLLVVFTSLF